MGRFCKIPYFLSKEAYAQEKIDAASLHKAKKELKDIRAKDVNFEDNGYNNLDLENKTGKDNLLKHCQISIACKHHKQFGAQIIRHTINSVNYAQ